jgi:shikimate kinase
MRVLLIGLMGSGKSTVGRLLSESTGWPYLDNDEMLREVTGLAAPDLMTERGEAGLHAAEVDVFDRALASPTPVVIGVAGWIVADPVSRARLRDAGTVVWLRASPETLLARAGSGRGRRSDATSLEFIEHAAAEREPWFADVADLIVDVEHDRPRAVVERILAEPEVAAARASSMQPPIRGS